MVGGDQLDEGGQSIFLFDQLSVCLERLKKLERLSRLGFCSCSFPLARTIRYDQHYCLNNIIT